MKQAYFVLLMLTGCILLYKTAHFRRHFPGKGFSCYLYFGRNEIMLSSSTSRRNAKQRQNALSLATVIGVIITSCMYFLMY